MFRCVVNHRRDLGRAGGGWTLMIGLCGLLGSAPGAWGQAAAVSDAAFEQMRQQAINRPRRILYTNDGVDLLHHMHAPTAEELLRSRTTPLKDSQVSTLFYCTHSAGWGLFSHNTKIGAIYTNREFSPNNMAGPLLEAGIDPLTVMVDAGHSYGWEVFWTMRMNDTHDSRLDPTSEHHDFFVQNPFKQRPGYLIGHPDPNVKRRWSAVNYENPEVRDLTVQFFQEVCHNYDVDGVEMDFWRHPTFFTNTYEGRACTQQQCDVMTDMVRRIRAATEQEGRQRGRPILICVRVPDSIPYCKAIGLDLDQWLKAGLVDLLVLGGYTQMNPWPDYLALGKKYHVKVFPSIDDSRVSDKLALAQRRSNEAYCGKAINAWGIGFDGLYLFNYTPTSFPNSPIWNQIGSPDTLRGLDKDFFVSWLGDAATRNDFSNSGFVNVPTLNPRDPVAMSESEPARVALLAYEPIDAASPPRLTLELRVRGVEDPAAVRVNLNGHNLGPPRNAGEVIESKYTDRLLDFDVPAEVYICGRNQVAVAATGKGALLSDLRLMVRYPSSTASASSPSQIQEQE